MPIFPTPVILETHFLYLFKLFMFHSAGENSVLIIVFFLFPFFPAIFVGVVFGEDSNFVKICGSLFETFSILILGSSLIDCLEILHFHLVWEKEVVFEQRHPYVRCDCSSLQIWVFQLEIPEEFRHLFSILSDCCY